MGDSETCDLHFVTTPSWDKQHHYASNSPFTSPNPDRISMEYLSIYKRQDERGNSAMLVLAAFSLGTLA